MGKLVLPEDRPRSRAVYVWACFGITIIPAIILGLLSRPFTQEHIGLLIAAVCVGGTIYWTASNLLTGVFTSQQGNYIRSEAPVRYWLNTGFVAMGTVLAIWFMVHQAAVVSDPNRPHASKKQLENKSSLPTGSSSTTSTPTTLP